MLSLAFNDVHNVMVDDTGCVRLEYRPADFPPQLRSANPRGELEATFAFPDSPELRQLALDLGDNWQASNRDYGPVLATAPGCRDGLLENQLAAGRTVTATDKCVIVRDADGLLRTVCPWDLMNSFTVHSGAHRTTTQAKGTVVTPVPKVICEALNSHPRV